MLTRLLLNDIFLIFILKIDQTKTKQINKSIGPPLHISETMKNQIKKKLIGENKFFFLIFFNVQEFTRYNTNKT